MAEKLAGRLHWTMASLDDYDLLSRHPQLLALIVSTLSDGDAPSSAKETIGALRALRDPAVLADTSFAVVGLGNSTHQRPQEGARQLCDAMEQAGAHKLMPCFEIDVANDRPLEKIGQFADKLESGLQHPA